jgi:hypothetical protein
MDVTENLQDGASSLHYLLTNKILFKTFQQLHNYEDTPHTFGIRKTKNLKRKTNSSSNEEVFVLEMPLHWLA